MTKFTAVYPKLDGRYFHTIWCRLPNAANSFIHKILKPIEPYCSRLATFMPDDYDSLNHLHVTLRYLGYADELSEEQIIADLDQFKAAVSKYMPLKLGLGKINIWHGNEKVRLNWEVLNPQVLKQIHLSLLEIPGYAFFSELEGENYSAHISLGDVDTAKLHEAKEYLSTLEDTSATYEINQLEINLASPQQRKTIALS